MTLFNLPYTADEATLPSALPTIDEIESATEVLNRTIGRKVVVVGEHYVVKYGLQVNPLEGETLLFLGGSTQVPVPRIYALFQRPHEDTWKTYIVMERITGPCLQSEWAKMSQETKQRVCSRLQEIFKDMRKLKTPGGYCSVGSGGLPDNIFWTNDPTQPFAGPFNTEADLNKALVAKYIESGLPKYKAEFYARAFKEVLRDHEPMFSHGDFQRKNVMLRRSIAKDTCDKKDIEPDVVVIDWECAGWYPSYWEYARAIFACGRWDDDWNCWVEQVLEPFRNECSWSMWLMNEMWC